MHQLGNSRAPWSLDDLATLRLLVALELPMRTGPRTL